MISIRLTPKFNSFQSILTSIDLKVDVLNDLAAHGVCCTVRGVGAVLLCGGRRNVLHALLVCVAVADIALDGRS
jgi:hypothetical protein